MGAQWKQKGREAAAKTKGKIFDKIAREIAAAAKGGADPSANPRLRMALEAAKKASVTKDTIERAIKKGSGQLDGGVQYDTVFYEGFAPHQVPVIVECLTENKNRTSSNVRVLFRKGQLGSSGSVSWDYQRVGQVEAMPPGPLTGAGAIDPEEAAIEAGAQEVELDGEGGALFYTEPTDLDAVAKALAERKWSVTAAKLAWRPKNPVSLDDEGKRAEVEAFLAALDEDDDVQALYPALA
ncbi:MAG: YebC/PmpR family DNA-binding transcriptional regulator [Sandaracinus sp.]